MDLKPQLEKAQNFLVQENYRDAMAIYQEILTANPKHVIALQAMGQIAYQVANYEAAEDYFQRSLTENASQYKIWIMLGEVCLKNRKSEKAVQAYRNAKTVQPGTSEAYLRLGNILNINGDNDEAAENFEKAFLMDRSSPSAFRRLSTIKTVELESEIAKMAKDRLADGLEDKSGQAHIHYGFAYIYEKLGDKKMFFEHLVAANRLQRDLAPPWQAIFEQNAIEIKNNFTTETLQKGLGEETKSFTPIFIFGMPRSGTTLTEQIIASHPKVFGADELDILTRFVVNQVAIWTQTPLLGGINQLDTRQLQELSVIYQTRMQKIVPGWDFITDKFLANYLAIGLIKLIMPWSKVINLKRHPMDIALSIYRNFFLDTLPFCFDLEDLAKFYCLYRDMMDFWEELTPGFVYHVSYESLVENYEPEARKLIEYCGLPWDDACLEPHKNKRAVMTLSQDQVRKPIYSSSIGKWKEFEDYLEPFRAACQKYGYNVDDYDGR